MIIDVARMKPAGERFVGDEPEETLDVTDAIVVSCGPVHYELTGQLVSNELIVRGRLAATVVFRCSRCTAAYPRAVSDNDFTAVYEIGETDEYVDLTPEIRESIILAFPTYPVCSDSCRGLCAQCGANLNETTCACRPPADGRWRSLDGLEL